MYTTDDVRKKLNDRKGRDASASLSSSSSKYTTDDVRRKMAERKLGAMSGSLATASDTLSKAYGGWNTASDMQSYQNSLGKVSSQISDFTKNYGDVLTNEQNSYLNNYLESINGLGDLSDVYGYYQNADAYNLAKKNYGFSEQYKGASYDDIQDALKNVTDEDEKNFLSSYTSYSSEEDFKKAIDAAGDYDKKNFFEKLVDSQKANRLYYDIDENGDVETYHKKTEAPYAEQLNDAYENFKVMNASAKYKDIENSENFDVAVRRANESHMNAVDNLNNLPIKSSELNDELKRLAKGIFQIKGEQAYLDFMKDIQVEAGAEVNKGKADKYAQWSLEHPGIATTISALSSPMLSLGSTADLANAVSLNGFNYNPYVGASGLQNIVQNSQSEISDKIYDGIDSPFLAEAAKIGYDALSTGVVSRIGQRMFGGAYNILMGGGSFATTYSDALNNGMNPEKAAEKAFVAGFVETMTEQIGMDWAFTEGKASISKIVKSFLAEGSEELVGNIANAIYDNVANGNASDINQAINEYIVRGYSEEEARKMAYADFAKETAEAFVAAGLSAGAETAIYTGVKAVADKKNREKNFSKVDDKVADIQVKNIVPSADGVKLITDDGAVVDSSKAVVNSSQADLLNSALEIKDDTERQIYIANYEGQDVEAYKAAFDLAYEYGKSSYKIEDLTKITASLLSEKALTKIYSAGNTYAQNEAKRIGVETDKLIKQYASKSVTGMFDDSEIDTKTLSSKEKISYNFAKSMSQVLGMNIKLTKNAADNGQHYTDENGVSYLVFDVNATAYTTANAKADKAYFISTVAHESTHFMKAQNLVGYNALRDAVIRSLGDKYNEFLEVHRKEIEDDYKENADYYKERGIVKTAEDIETEADDEVIARACEDMLNKPENIERLFADATSEEQTSIKEAIVKWFDSIRAALKKLLKNFSSYAREAQFIRKSQENFDAIEKLWLEGIDKAVKANKARMAMVDEFVSKARTAVEKGNAKATEALMGDLYTEKEISEAKNPQYSLRLKDSIYDNAVKYNSENEKLVRDSVLKKAKKAIDYTAERLEKLKDFIPADIEEGKSQDESVIVKNGSYGRSAEHSLICPRSIVNNWFLDAVSNRIGRPLTVEEGICCSQILAAMAGNQRECQYCYVARDRNEARAMYQRYYDEYKAVFDIASADKKSAQKILDFINSDAFAEELEKNTKGRKFVKGYNGILKGFADYAYGREITPNLIARYVASLEDGIKGEMNLDIKDLATKESIDAAMEDPKKQWILSDAKQYVKSAAQAKLTSRFVKVDGEYRELEYVAYNGSVLKFSPELVEALNEEFGLRMYSFSDYHPSFILEDMQIVTDAAVRGLKVLAYTKDTGFVRMFAPTGMAINVSTYAYLDQKYKADDALNKARDAYNQNKNDETRAAYLKELNRFVILDEMQGANIQEVIALRKEFPNVGAVMVATNDDLVEWAMAQDWVDVVIPHHTVRLGHTASEIFGWKDYKSSQEDKKMKDWNSGYKSHIAPTDHANNRDLYEKALEENHLTHRFPQWSDNPNYMKLVNETRVPYNKLNAVQPTFGSNDVIDQEIARVSKEVYGLIPGFTSKEQQEEMLQQDIDEAVKRINSKDLKINKSTRIDSTGVELSEGQDEYFANSKARDDNGNLLRLFHGTEYGGFVVFDPKKTDDGRSLFATDKKLVASSYSGNGFELNPYEFKDLSVEDIQQKLDNYNSTHRTEYLDYVEWRIDGNADDWTIQAFDDKGDPYGRDSVLNPSGSMRIHKGSTPGEAFISFMYGLFRDNIYIDDIDVLRGNYPIYANLENPLVVDAGGHSWRNIPFSPHENELAPYAKRFIHYTRKQFGWVDDEDINISLGILGKSTEDFVNAGQSDLTVEEDEEWIRVAHKLDELYQKWRNEQHTKEMNGESTENDKSFAELFWNNVRDTYSTRDLARNAFYEGYDGVIIKNLVDIGHNGIVNAIDNGESTVVIAFNSDQFKSVYNLNPTKNKDMRKSSRLDINDDQYKEMKKHFGTTNDFNVVGYLLKDGYMLDFSGKHWGGGSTGQREVDHRDIEEVLTDENNGYDAMTRMITNGNIRLMPEVGGINLSVPPTDKQRVILGRYIDYMLSHGDGVITLDFDNENGQAVKSIIYDKELTTITNKKVMNDIDNYFRGGRQSELMQFHTSYSKKIAYSTFGYSEATPGKLGFTDERIDELLSGGWYGSTNKDYAQAYIAYMSPMDFLRLTTGKNQRALERIKRWNDGEFAGETEDNSFDFDKFAEHYNFVPLQLNIDEEAREVVGHEGRHRMWQLSQMGYDQIPVLLFNYQNKYDKQRIESIDLMPQWFQSLDDSLDDSDRVTVKDLIPFSSGNKELIKEKFGSGSNAVRQFSKRMTDDRYKLIGENERMAEQIRLLNQDVKDLSKLVKLSYKTTADRVWNPQDLTTAAEALKKTSNSSLNTNTLRKALSDAYTSITNYFTANTEKGEADDLNYVMSKCNDVALKLFEKSDYKPLSDNQMNLKLNGVEASDDLKNEATELVRELSEEEAINNIALDVYKKYWTVTKLKTATDVSDAKIKELNAKHRETMDKAIEDQKLADRIHYGRIINELRNDREAKLSEYKEHVKQRQENEKVQAERRILIKKISDRALELNKWLNAPRAKEGRYIPEALRLPVAKLVNAIDFSSKQLLGLTGQTSQKGLPKAYTPTKTDVSLRQALELVHSLVLNSESHMSESDIDNGSLTQLDLPPQFGQMIDKLFKDVEAIERQVRQDNEYILQLMSLEDLQNLKTIVTAMKTSVTQMNSLISSANAHSMDEVGMNTIMTAQSLGAKVADKIPVLKTFQNFLENGESLPIYVFKRFGSGARTVFESLQNGQDAYANRITEIKGFTDSLYTTEEINKWNKDVHTFRVFENGQYVDMKMTTAQMMSLYCLSKRDQAQTHLYGGGIRIGAFKDGNKTVDQVQKFTLTRSLMDNIITELKKDEKAVAVADALQKYMSTTCADWGNEVTMKRWGIKGFTETNYFPIKSDDNMLANDPKDKQSSIYALLNLSFTKPLTEKANNQILVGNIFEVFATHSSQMAKYNTLALPVLDTIRWWNYKTRTEENDDDTFTDVTVRGQLEYAFGAGANKYIRTLLDDINGIKEKGRMDDAAVLTRRYKVAAVGFNLQVAALQPLSYLRAVYAIDRKYLLKALTRKPSVKKCNEVSGIAKWKALGFFETDVSRGLSHIIMHDDTVVDKVVQSSMKLAELGDTVTWGYLWNASEEYVKDTTTLKPGTKAFDDAVNNKFRDIIYKTQVVDSQLTRSQYMRGTDSYTRILTAFMSEPTVSINVLMDSYEDFNAEYRRTKSFGTAFKKSGKMIALATETYVVGAVVESILRGALGTIRDDDDDEEILEKIRSHFAEEINPLAKLPYFKDILSIFQGYSSSRLDDEAISQLTKALKLMFAEDKDGYKIVIQTLKAASQLAGIPLGDLLRIKAIWNNTVGKMYPSCYWD